MATVAEGGADRIALANEPPFRLGAIEVIPAWRQVRSECQGRTLEPRVMQVLVALARAEGGIVGRDELIARCWGGRIVGENAINRVISILRALAAETQAFEIETITKVGYRLHRNGARAEPALVPSAPLLSSLSRRTAIATVSAGVATAAAGAGGYWLWREDLSPQRRAAQRHYQAAIDSERLGDAGRAQAIARYEQAVRTDPNYAPAWGGLARALASSVDTLEERQIEPVALRIDQAADRALRLDPGNADALLAQVAVTPGYRNWARQQRVAEDALARCPELGVIRALLATSLANVGRNREALVVIRNAVAREPLMPGYQARLAWLLWQTGHAEASRARFDAAARRWPEHMFVWVLRFMFLSFTGATAEALAMTRGANSIAARIGPLPANLATICARGVAPGAGVQEKSAAVAAIIAGRKQGRIASFISIPYLAAMGELTTAFEQCFDYMFGKHDPLTGERVPLAPYAERWTDFLFAIPAAAMRADPRFPKLTDAVGLDDYWRATGSRPDFQAHKHFITSS
jgi:DNA-binding winged helix-turn-helix (wHTH) protein/tetratricopeptide (TPR) repeat protein